MPCAQPLFPLALLTTSPTHSPASAPKLAFEAGWRRANHAALQGCCPRTSDVASPVKLVAKLHFIGIESHPANQCQSGTCAPRTVELPEHQAPPCRRLPLCGEANVMNRARKALPEECRRIGVKSVKFQRRQWPVAARMEVLEAWSRNKELPAGKRKSKRRFCEARGLQSTQLNQWIAQRELSLGTHRTSKRVQFGYSQDHGKFRQMAKDLHAWTLDMTI